MKVSKRTQELVEVAVKLSQAAHQLREVLEQQPLTSTSGVDALRDLQDAARHSEWAVMECVSADSQAAAEGERLPTLSAVITYTSKLLDAAKAAK